MDASLVTGPAANTVLDGLSRCDVESPGTSAPLLGPAAGELAGVAATDSGDGAPPAALVPAGPAGGPAVSAEGWLLVVGSVSAPDNGEASDGEETVIDVF
jgi:hypothetical protein